MLTFVKMINRKKNLRTNLTEGDTMKDSQDVSKKIKD